MEKDYGYHSGWSNLHGSDNNSDSNGDNDDLEKLLAIPIENLEKRVKEIEDEITERRRIKEALLRELEHQRVGLEDAINQLEFDRFNPIFMSRKTALQSQILGVEQSKFHEEISCFRDVVTLKEKLRFAQEELKKQKEKSKLLLNGKANGRNKETA